MKWPLSKKCMDWGGKKSDCPHKHEMLGGHHSPTPYNHHPVCHAVQYATPLTEPGTKLHSNRSKFPLSIVSSGIGNTGGLI